MSIPWVALYALLVAAVPAEDAEFTLTPAAEGRQLVRVSVPFVPGTLNEGQALVAFDGARELPASARVLTWHPQGKEKKRSARRALVTFPYEFADRRPVSFRLRSVDGKESPGPGAPVEVTVGDSAVTIAYRDGPTLTARLVAPERTEKRQPTIETVESNAHYNWRRIVEPDATWPRVIEVRVDALGGVVLVAHLQRRQSGDAYAPEFGWEVNSRAAPGRLRTARRDVALGGEPVRHEFEREGAVSFLFDRDQYRLEHPAAPHKRRGFVDVRPARDGGFTYRYMRCPANERVPMQQASWRRAELVIAPAGLASLTATLESPHEERIAWQAWDALYDTGPPVDLTTQPELAALLAYHHDAIAQSAAVGDDWGNVTGYSDGQRTGSPFGMNRLNHGPAIFEEAWRSGDRRLREVAVNWCDNFHDLSIWWGPGETGGTRYNNIRAQNRTPIDNDSHFMWRSNDAVNFCTKGYSAFFLAYEQTGDPRHRESLDAQVSYARRSVHCDRGEARNIGDADDFMRLHRYTGDRQYLDEALRLFRELRTKLSSGNLFSQGGQPIVSNPPFIEDDEAGYRHPFAKPYIIGYALLGLPKLAQSVQDEPRLNAVIEAVADFLAQSQDPAGGWRYPHPRSSALLLSQAMEHAWQLAEADRHLGPQTNHLDAIERVLRQRFHGWEQTRQVASGVVPWELQTGAVKDNRALGALYKHPGDRDFARDYTDGRLTFGSSPPEGLVYYPGVLTYYLKHRPAARLLIAPRPDEPLGKLLARARAGR
jgi:hypothetical protein